MAKVVFETQKRIADKKGLLMDWKARNHYQNADLARIWGCSSSTTSRFLQNPEKLTVEIIRRMKLTESERIRLTK